MNSSCGSSETPTNLNLSILKKVSLCCRYPFNARRTIIEMQYFESRNLRPNIVICRRILLPTVAKTKTYLKASSNIVSRHHVEFGVITPSTHHKPFSSVRTEANIYIATFPLPWLSAEGSFHSFAAAFGDIFSCASLCYVKSYGG